MLVFVFLFGLVLVIAGVAVFYWPLALIFSGLFIMFVAVRYEPTSVGVIASTASHVTNPDYNDN